VLRVLGSGQVYLEPLLAGEPVVSTVCNFGVARTLETDRLTYARVLRVLSFCLCLPPSLWKACWIRKGWVWLGVVAPCRGPGCTYIRAAEHFDGH